MSKEEGLVRAGIAHFSTYAVMRVPARVVIVATKRNSSLSTTDIIAIVSAGSFALLVGICLLFNHKHIFARKKDTFEEMMMPLPSPNDRQPISTFTRLEARAGSDEVEGSAEVDLVTLEDQNVVPIPDSVRIRRDIFRMASVEVEESVTRDLFPTALRRTCFGPSGASVPSCGRSCGYNQPSRVPSPTTRLSQLELNVGKPGPEGGNAIVHDAELHTVINHANHVCGSADAGQHGG